MDRQEKVTLTNLCMVYDDFGNVLIEDRVSKSYSGITFPGGHVHVGESFVDSVIREVFEETGLTIKNPILCGIKHWTNKDKSRYIVFCYKTKYFNGTITSSHEGEVKWVNIDDLSQMNLVHDMQETLKVFLDDKVQEYHGVYFDDKWNILLK